MALSLSQITTTKSTHPPRTVIYGVDGVGKTSLAAEFPAPVLYLPTEGEAPPSDVHVDTPKDNNGNPAIIESFNDLLDIFGELLTTEHEYKTVIVDSLDGLESLVWKATCARLGVASIEDPGFGKGYVEADSEWNEFLSAVGMLAKSGIYVVQLAHPEIVRFDSPVTDPYSRYTIKLHKRANALVRERADIVAFVNYRVSIKEKEVARQTKVARGDGGNERLIHFNEKPGFTAKNRYGMPDSVTYKRGKGFDEIAKHLPSNDNAAAESEAA